jgi:hypothetical protein
MGARTKLIESLHRIEVTDPKLLIPSHGNIMDNPSAPISALISRMESCFECYAAISALRFYFPEVLADYSDTTMAMPVTHDQRPLHRSKEHCTRAVRAARRYHL